LTSKVTLDQTKQIVIAHYTLPPVVGGVENTLKPLAEVFTRNGYLVNLIAGEGMIEGPNLQTSIIPDLNPDNPHILNMQRVLRIGSLPESYEVRLQTIQKKIEMTIGNINNVIIHNIMTMPINLTLTEAFWNYIQKFPQKKFYLWTHDLAWQMDEYQQILYDKPPWSLLKTPLENVVYITVSETRRRQLSELMGIPRRRIVVVPNVFKYQDFFRFDGSTDLLVQHMSIFNRFPIILIPARLIPRKNLEESIRVIAALQETFPHILAIITGKTNDHNDRPSDYAESLMQLARQHKIAENILFLSEMMKSLNIAPDKNRLIVRDLYFLCHMVLLLSLDEGFGLPILEAGSLRVPLAVSQIPVFKEIVGDGALFLRLDEDAEKNAAKIRQYFTDNPPATAKLFGRIFENYNWDTLWEAHLKKLFAE